MKLTCGKWFMILPHISRGDNFVEFLFTPMRIKSLEEGILIRKTFFVEVPLSVDPIR